MGCDGGTIPRRDELVRVKKKPEQKDKDAEREFRWLHCALTQERLQEPIVMCGLGRLYSKQNVLEGLLEKDKMPESVRHIRTMKDIRLLKLTRNPAYTAEDKSEGLLDTRAAPYICKLIGLEMSGKFRFVALWSCGHVMSERALKQIKKANSSSQVCPICQVPFNVDDVIVLNGNEEDLELMQAKMEMRQERLKAGKKDKKEKEKKAKTIEEEKSDEEGGERNAVKPEYEGPSTSKGKPAASGSSKSDSKLTKLVVNPKRLGATANTMEDPEIKRLKTEYSVAKDPKATDVYKSLFTTHDSEKEQNRAHWVTYNPFYN